MKRILLAMLAVVLVCVSALSQNVTLTGVIQGANGLPASNTLLTFAPTQPFYIPGINSTQPVGNIYSSVAPTNPCTISGQFYTYTAASPQTVYQCQLGSWSAILGGTGITSFSVATAHGFTGTVTSGNTPILTMNVDSSHLLPVNTGSSSLFLNQAGTYTSPSAGGVTSLNTLTGALTLAAGSGLSLSQTGSTITISLGTVFSINSFTGGETVELGTSVINPSFSASYSTTPASANITNTEGIGSPLVLSSPYTSGTVSGSFTHTTITTTTFTLSATQGTTQTATQTINWQPAIFGGVGTAGATSTVTASGTTAVLSNGAVLSRIQLGAEVAGSTCPPATCFTSNPSGQVVYLLLTGGSHTFVDNVTGLPVPFNAPLTVSFTNSNGVPITMYLYSTSYAVYGTSTIRVQS